MTLLELLVKELPARGGWPQKAVVADGYSHVPGVHFWDDEGKRVDFDSLINMPAGLYSVSRGQYEATIKQAEWNGEGLPPVGTECEWCDNTGEWLHVKIVYLSEWVIVLRSMKEGLGKDVEIAKDLVMDKKQEFRPIRTEADCKRELTIRALQEWMGQGYSATQIYDLAIAKGEIPGVTTVPNVGQVMRATESCSREDAQKIVDLLNGA